MSWVLRGLLGVGGVVVAFVAWPVANGAWQAQKADAVVSELRTGQTLDLASVQAGKVERLTGAQLEDDSVGLLRLPGAIGHRPSYEGHDGPADAEKGAQDPGHCVHNGPSFLGGIDRAPA